MLCAKAVANACGMEHHAHRVPEERYPEATAEYEKAVKLNPSAENIFALAQAYMNTGRYSDADTQFNKVLRMAPAASPPIPAPTIATSTTMGSFSLSVSLFSSIERSKDIVSEDPCEMVFVCVTGLLPNWFGTSLE